MDVKIVKMDPTKVVGMQYVGKNLNQEIAELWQVFMKKYPEVKNSNPNVMYGLCYEYQQDGTFGYLAGVPVTQIVDVPQGMAVKEIPSVDYAVFTFKDHISKIGEFWNDIYSKYLPEHQLVSDMSGMSFELYDHRFGQNGELDVYIPLK